MFERFSEAYARLTRRLVAAPKRMMAAYAVLIALTVGLFSITPTGFIPAQDQGYFLTVVQLAARIVAGAHGRGAAQGC
jgi:multidrug efflux pump subunit AcrB